MEELLGGEQVHRCCPRQLLACVRACAAPLPQVFDCRAAEVECSKLVLQGEAMRLSLTRIGCEYRAYHTWLLKTGGRGVARACKWWAVEGWG